MTDSIIVIGVRAVSSLSIDAVPDITSIRLQVISAAPALSPVEAEAYVSIPGECAMARLPRTTEIRSVSKYGQPASTIVFDDDTNIYFANQLVNERTQAVRRKTGRVRRDVRGDTAVAVPRGSDIDGA